VKIKQKPEDFSVKESYRFDEVAGGAFRVYLMDKQKLSTFDALERIRRRFGLKPGAISFCGLKDKQGRTEQLIAVQDVDVDLQEPDLRLKFLGTTDKPLSAANTTSNRFSVTVRALTSDDLAKLNVAAAEVNRLGVINYFDSQRFGSLKHGQGFIAKDLLRGDFEAALRNYMARPSPLDRSDDARAKQFWKENWRKWDRKPPFKAPSKYDRILYKLREKADDFVGAFLQIDADYRALLIFTYQSYLWNEGVRRYLQLTLPRESLFPLPYQAGTVLFHRDADPATLKMLREQTFPLFGPNTPLRDPKIKEAAEWVLGKEKLTLEGLRIKEAPKLLYFKHEERPILMRPHKLVVGRAQPDELNKPQTKLNVAFTLPPGSYATLVVKRLFHFSYRDDTDEEIIATQIGVRAAAEKRAREERGDEGETPRSSSKVERKVPQRRAEPEAAVAPRSFRKPRSEAPAKPRSATPEASLNEPRPGFRERQRVKKAQKAESRAVTQKLAKAKATTRRKRPRVPPA
jgi:tRNA pseudouridine13 synthase